MNLTQKIMKKTNLLLGLLLIAFVWACGDAKQTSETDNADNEIANENVVAAESFDTFYEKFIKDKAFQKERTKFPVAGGMHEDGETETWTDANWKPVEKHINSFDTTELAVEIKKTEKRIEHSVGLKNSGLGGSYTFELIDNQWYLTECNMFNY